MKLMPPWEVLSRLQMGYTMKARGSMYCVSPETYYRMKESLEIHLASGAIKEGEHGLYENKNNPPEER